MSEPADKTNDANDLYNSWPKLKQKEFDSVVGSSLKSLIYYQQHPREKLEFLKKIRELFEDWKKARIEADDYHAWRKDREFSIDEVQRDTELFEIQYKKWTEFFNQSLYYPGPEVQEMLLEAQKMKSDKK